MTRIPCLIISLITKVPFALYHNLHLDRPLSWIDPAVSWNKIQIVPAIFNSLSIIRPAGSITLFIWLVIHINVGKQFSSSLNWTWMDGHLLLLLFLMNDIVTTFLVYNHWLCSNVKYFCEIIHFKFWHFVLKLGSKKVKFLLKGWRNSPRSPRQISLILFLFPTANSFCLLQWVEVIF